MRPNGLTGWQWMPTANGIGFEPSRIGLNLLVLGFYKKAEILEWYKKLIQETILYKDAPPKNKSSSNRF